jgi:hypothetical protein
MISLRSELEPRHYSSLENARRELGLTRPCGARAIVEALKARSKVQLPPCHLPAGITLEARSDSKLDGFPHLASPNKRAIFVFQSDGNFVLRTPEGKILWSTKTNGMGARVLSVQSADGNLVLRASRAPNAAVIWSLLLPPSLPPTIIGHPNAQLVVQDDGNAVLLDANGQPYWSTKSKEFKNRQDEGGVLDDIGDLLEDVGGTALTVLYEASGVAMLVNAVENIADGVRLDKVISRCAEDAAKNVTDYGPMIVSLVPGIGTGISAAIAGGLALAQGKRIDQALMDAAVGALPGGTLAGRAARMGIAAVQGQSLDEVALGGLVDSEQERQAIRASLRLAKDVAEGKPVEQSFLNAADVGLAALPDEIRKAVQVGTALAQGEKLQDVFISQVPALVAPGGPLQEIGQQLAVAAEVQNLVPPEAQHGFNVGLGMVLYRASVAELDAARKTLDPVNLKAFDIAVALY